jgi:predicted nucleic acid-binding protein
MTRFVIFPDVALRLAAERATPSGGHKLLAPTLLRSQVLSRLYGDVRAGKLAKEDAGQQLDHIRKLRLRLLGDRVLQGRAWSIADHLGWPDTLDAEYVALTELQADALVTLDARLGRAIRDRVRVADYQELL